MLRLYLISLFDQYRISFFIRFNNVLNNNHHFYNSNQKLCMKMSICAPFYYHDSSSSILSLVYLNKRFS